MDQRSPPEFILDAFADPVSVRDVVKGILHTIFFHRYFPSVVPQSHDVLDLSLPYIKDVELETMIDQRAAALERQLLDAEHAATSSGAAGATGGRAQVVVQFFERRRRKAWLMRGDDEVCWERWTLKVTVVEPKTEKERAKLRQAMGQTLLSTVMKIINYVNLNKDHIPPITATSGNPFPFQISVNQEATGWATRVGLF